jgi:hypothetical protein
MKKMIIAVFLILAPLSSHALLEVRAGYGTNTLSDDNWAGVSKIDNGTGFNGDFLFKPPLLTNFGFGIRYEQIKYDGTLLVSPFSKGTFTMKRISALVNYRIIDTFAYVGPIGTIGLNTSVKDDSGDTLDDKFNWSAGFEGGVHLGLISVGAEVGKFFGKFSFTGAPDLDLSGLYGKVIVGFGF